MFDLEKYHKSIHPANRGVGGDPEELYIFKRLQRDTYYKNSDNHYCRLRDTMLSFIMHLAYNIRHKFVFKERL